jgi:F0F1-type ATP synthase membrane subunit b/b'
VIKLPPDITFVIQLVGFVVFWQLMRVLIFSPMQEALKVRAQKTGGARERAEAVIAEAVQVDASIEAALAEARREGALRADEIRKRSEAEEHTITSRYRDEAASLLERERALTSSQVQTARAPLDSEAARLADGVVQRVLGRAA